MAKQAQPRAEGAARTERTASSTASRDDYDAVVIGSGPNGLSAAIELARGGASVLVVEGHDLPGGGARTADLFDAGSLHDLCSSVHAMAGCSPFFRSLELEKDLGLTLVHPELPLAHPVDGGDAAVMHRSLAETAEGLGRDGPAYRRLYEPLVERAEEIFETLLGPLGLPPNPFLFTRFGLGALPSALSLARGWFDTELARALFAGHAAHSVVPLDRPFTSAIAHMLTIAGHHAGWPFVRGGSGALTEALIRLFESLGGELVCAWPVKRLEELPRARAYLFDTGPHALSSIAGARLPESYRKRLEAYRYGPGICKVDYLLSEAVPWTADACRRAGTVHVGGWLDEVVRAERAPWENQLAPEPFVLVAQASLCDETRAPAGKQTLWAYGHVPPGSSVDHSAAIEAQIERFAPGFRDCVLERRVSLAPDYAAHNPNLVGGDVTGGANDGLQLLLRPTPRIDPYATPASDLFLCSASTPPGGGVHGMCGYHAAKSALHRLG